jgi:hypothetical protein
MANFRQVHTKIWKDGWFLDLAPAHKLFFIYLFTNECASISGLFELPERVMCFESGLSPKEIQAAFEALGKANKAFYEDGVVWVVNMRKYHETESPKVQTRIEKDVEAVKDCELSRAYCEAYGIDRVYDTLSIPPYMSSIVSSKSSVSVEKPKKPKRNGTGPLPDIPESLATPDFLNAWGEWRQHRKEIKKKMTPLAAKRLLNKLDAWGPERASSAINHSILNGWTGIYEDKDRRNGQHAPDPTREKIVPNEDGTY